MPNIKETKRLVKRIILSNLLENDYTIALTPLISGKHGIGKSQIARQIAKELNGECITIEGGTLKEGEITGIPYQYKNEEGDIEFKFLPYYVVERIRKTEKLISNQTAKQTTAVDLLQGEENKYSQNNLTFEEKEELLLQKKITPVIIFFDEINRTDSSVFRELMNIILTRSVNGYKFPWWVFIIAAMNPSTLGSIYSTNEIDPAQLDRFIKINVREDANEWIEYAALNEFDPKIINFIANHNEALSSNDERLEDDEKPTPSPRGWAMVNSIFKGKDKLNKFFDIDEKSKAELDIKKIITSKLGTVTANMFYSSLTDSSKLVYGKDIFKTDGNSMPQEIKKAIKKQTTAKNYFTCSSVMGYLKNNINDIINDDEMYENLKHKVKEFIELLDESSKMVFLRNISFEKTKNGDDLFDYLYDIIDNDILETIQINNSNLKKIEEE